jgi:hypothetical protein
VITSYLHCARLSVLSGYGTHPPKVSQVRASRLTVLEWLLATRESKDACRMEEV